jgi:hypothetical protein
MLGEEPGLVVAAFALALPVERHRKREVRPEVVFLEGQGEGAAQNVAGD